MHEAVRAEQNASRSATHGRQEPRAGRRRTLEALAPEGTGRARAWHDASAELDRRRRRLAVRSNFGGKVNRKGARPLSAPRSRRTRTRERSAVLADDSFDEPSTKDAAAVVEAWGKQTPLIVVAQQEQEAIAKSFRNLAGRARGDAVGGRDLGARLGALAAVSEGALQLVQGRAS